MLVPLSITLYFSFIRYVLNSLRKPEWTKPALSNWRGFGNYEFVLNNKDFILAIVRVLLISPFFVMPAVNAVLWINMILDPVLGLQGLAVAGINEVIDGLRNLPILGGFFSMWPELEPISFRANLAMDPICGFDFYDIAAIRRSATKRSCCTGWCRNLVTIPLSHLASFGPPDCDRKICLI